jgi:hypothetical protein
MRLRWIVLALFTVTAGAAPPTHAASATLTISADQIVRRFDHRRLIGSNVALWNGPECYRDPEAQWLREMAQDNAHARWLLVRCRLLERQRRAPADGAWTRRGATATPWLTTRAYAPSLLWVPEGMPGSGGIRR